MSTVHYTISALKPMTALRADSLGRLRLNASRFYAAVLWLHVPVVALIAEHQGLNMWPATLLMAAVALATTLVVAARGGGTTTRLTMAVTTTFAPALLAYAAHDAWQAELYFLAFVAMLAVYVDWRAMALGIAAAGAHDALINTFFPSNIIAAQGLGTIGTYAVTIVAAGIVLFSFASGAYRATRR